MRYDTLVEFVHEIEGEYNYETGDNENPTLYKTARYACIMDTDLKTQRKVYGQERAGSYTVQLASPYLDVYDYLLIGGNRFDIDYSIRPKLSNKHIFVVHEVL